MSFVCFSYQSIGMFLIIVDTNVLSVICVVNIFSPFIVFYFITIYPLFIPFPQPVVCLYLLFAFFKEM